MTRKLLVPLACAALLAPGCRTGGTFKAGDGSQKIDVAWTLFSELTLTGPDEPPAPSSRPAPGAPEMGQTPH